MTQQGVAAQGAAPRRSVIDTLEIDVRLLGMLMAFAALAISTMQDRTSENITSVHKATTGYDVADHAVGAVKDIATVGLPVYGAVRAIKYMSQGMGDSTSVSTTGDGNGFESNKVHIVNETTSSVSGSESNPTVSATPSATNASPSTSETTTETPLVQ